VFDIKVIYTWYRSYFIWFLITYVLFFQGYFRKGEVDFAAELYNDALVSYQVCFPLISY